MSVKQSVDEYLGRTYHRERFNCFHLAAEVWMDLTSQDLIKLYGDAIRNGVESKKLSRRLIQGFREIRVVQDPCIVLLQNPRTSPHIGVYLRGRVLHIREHSGVRFEAIHFARLGFKTMRFALPC